MAHDIDAHGGTISAVMSRRGQATVWHRADHGDEHWRTNIHEPASLQVATGAGAWKADIVGRSGNGYCGLHIGGGDLFTRWIQMRRGAVLLDA